MRDRGALRPQPCRRLTAAAAGAALLFGAGQARAQVAPIGVELGGQIGAGVRLGDGPHYAVVERAGLTFGAGGFVTLEPAFSLGLGIEHTDLGRERSAASGIGAVEVIRDLNAVWATIRLNLVRAEAGELSIGFGPGLAWQSADAAGVATPVLAPRPFTCSGSDAADLALRVGLGGALALGGGLWLQGGAGFDNVRLSSELMDGCVFGAGSVALFQVRAGLSYRFEVPR